MLTTKPQRRPPAHRYPIWRLIRANFYDFGRLLRESWVALTGFAMLALAGTLYLHYQHPSQLGFAAALYETLKLVSFQTGAELPHDWLGRALFFLIPLLGLALIFQSVLNFGRLLLDKSSRREAWQVALASTYSDHVIVCGLGRVGTRVAAQLIEAGYQPVVIERNWSGPFVERTLNLKVPVVVGDARELATLRQAGLARARAIIAAIQDDLTNIEIALTARTARPGMRVVLRAFGEELDQNLERSFGPHSAFSASALAAPTYVAAAVSREIDCALRVGEQLLGITTLALQSEHLAAGALDTIEEQHGVRVLHSRIPDGTSPHRLKRGEHVTLLGPLAALEAVRLMAERESQAEPALRVLQHPTDERDTVIVCGLGKAGYRVVRQLDQLTPRPRIVVVRMNDGRADLSRRIGRLVGVKTVLGDARDAEVLREAGIDRAYSVAALTSDDLLNLQIGLAARRARPDVHVVQRAFSDVLADKLADMFGIRTVYSTSALASPTLAAAAVLGDITHAFGAAGTLFSADEIGVRAGDALASHTIERVRTLHGSLVLTLRRDGATQILPSLGTRLVPGDQVTLLAPLAALARVRAAPKKGLRVEG